MVETLISEQRFVSRVDLMCMSYYASLIAMHKKQFMAMPLQSVDQLKPFNHRL